MKNTLLFFLILCFASGCSNFYHLHYRKLNKVSAEGNYRVVVNSTSKNIPTTTEKKLTNNFKSTSVSFQDSPQQTITCTKYNKSKTIFHAKKNPEVFSRINKNRKKILKNKFQAAKDHKGLIIFAMILLGLALLAYGIGLLVAGIFSAVYWISLIGIAVIGLGLLPFLGLISMIVGDKFNSHAKQFEEKKR